MQSRVYLQLEVAESSLTVFAGLNPTEQASIRDGFQGKLFGNDPAGVIRLLGDPVFNPDIPANSQGMASQRDLYARAAAAAAAYNDLKTGMEILLPAAGVSGEPPQPNSTYLIWRNGEWVVVTDWEGHLVEGGSNRLTRNLATDSTTPISAVVLATMHVSVEVPISFG